MLWGNGTEHFQEIAFPDKQGQWLMFNEDHTLVGVITAFPDGLSLDPYPKLRRTLSQLPPAREFFFNSAQLLQGQAPESATLYRTGKATTTHQYYIKHSPGRDNQLVMAVFVLDPYEQLLDGSHAKYLSYIKSPYSQPSSLPPTDEHSSAKQEFLGLQQFARGEIALFASCGTKHPDIAREAYQKAIDYGLPDTKQRAEAHHRWGLAYLSLGQTQEAKAQIEQALTIQPHSAPILNSYGSVLAQLREIPQSVKAYEQALALQPNYTHARFNLAEAFESINPKRAIQEYETFLILAEDNPDEAGKVAIAKSKIKALQGGTNR
ncbi:MAG: tetratricopeptide repeat protein [Nitrospirales bacterium]